MKKIKFLIVALVAFVLSSCTTSCADEHHPNSNGLGTESYDPITNETWEYNYTTHEMEQVNNTGYGTRHGIQPEIQ